MHVELDFRFNLVIEKLLISTIRNAIFILNAFRIKSFQSRNRETFDFNNQDDKLLELSYPRFNLVIEKLLISTEDGTIYGWMPEYVGFNLVIEKLLISTQSRSSAYVYCSIMVSIS